MAEFLKAAIEGDEHYSTDRATKIITDSEIEQINAIQDAIDGLNVPVEDLNKLAGSGESIASGTQVSYIETPSEGTAVDEEARRAIGEILSALEGFGIVSPK